VLQTFTNIVVKRGSPADNIACVPNRAHVDVSGVMTSALPMTTWRRRQQQRAGSAVRWSLIASAPDSAD